jgi:hypothetical protein
MLAAEAAMQPSPPYPPMGQPSYPPPGSPGYPPGQPGYPPPGPPGYPAPGQPGPNKGLLVTGAVGAGLCALVSIAGYLPVPADLRPLVALGYALLVVGAVGLLKRSPLWMIGVLAWAGMFLLNGVRMAGLFENFGMAFVSLTGLASAVLWGAVGLTVLLRRADGNAGLGVVTGILLLLRAAVSFLIAVMGLVGGIGGLTGVFQISGGLTLLVDAALTGFFLTTLSARPPAPGGAPVAAPPAWRPPGT